MTDLETFVNMLKRANISCSQESRPILVLEEWISEGRRSVPNRVYEDGTTVEVERGYIGFVTTLFFGADGRLVDMGAWE